MDNLELKTMVMDLIKYADDNRYIVLKLGVDFITMNLDALLANMQGETFMIHYNGKEWIN